MRVMLLMFLLCPFTANAGCLDVAYLNSKNLYIDISDGGCGELEISFSDQIQPDGAPVINSIKSYPFKDECTRSYSQGDYIISGFSCRVGGRTPLAGATYQIKQFGTYIQDCGESGGKNQISRRKYICISGCKKTTPKSLDYKDTCD